MWDVYCSVGSPLYLCLSRACMRFRVALKSIKRTLNSSKCIHKWFVVNVFCFSHFLFINMPLLIWHCFTTIMARYDNISAWKLFETVIALYIARVSAQLHFYSFKRMRNLFACNIHLHQWSSLNQIGRVVHCEWPQSFLVFVTLTVIILLFI